MFVTLLEFAAVLVVAIPVKMVVKAEIVTTTTVVALTRTVAENNTP